MYGDEVVVPLELEISSLMISLQGDILDEEAQNARFQQLESLDERESEQLNIRRFIMQN